MDSEEKPPREGHDLATEGNFSLRRNDVGIRRSKKHKIKRQRFQAWSSVRAKFRRQK